MTRCLFEKQHVALENVYCLQMLAVVLRKDYMLSNDFFLCIYKRKLSDWLLPLHVHADVFFFPCHSSLITGHSNTRCRTKFALELSDELINSSGFKKNHI